MADTAKIKAALKHHFGFDSFKGNQLEIIDNLLDGNDVFVLMPTGGGKSLCYQLPALMSDGTAVVVSPLIALMKNQVDAIRSVENADSVAHFLNSSLSRSAAHKVRADVMSGKTKLLYVAPESLSKQDNIDFLKSVKISFFAVDEAHCISEWGHDFRPEYRKIRSMISAIGKFPLIALTATATPKVQHDIQKNLAILNAKIFKSSFNRPNLNYEVRPKTKDVDRDIIRFIRQNPGKSGIIYCLSRKRVEELAEILNINNIKALPYHAGMDANSRAANQDAFLQEKVDVIVATIAFGMGIDKPDVRYVLHYDIPKSLEGYYQETGRAGRDGGEGRCITYYSKKDLQKLDKLVQTKPIREQDICHQLLSEVADYAESSVCRRKILLHYFGENFDEDNCGCCDNCLGDHTKMEATEELLALLDLVVESRKSMRSEYLVNVLVGRATDEVKSNYDNNLHTFGLLSDFEERNISALVRQAIIHGYLVKDLDNYGIIKITPKGMAFRENPSKFYIVEDKDFTDIDADNGQAQVSSSALDPILYSMLRGLRKDLAKEHGLPPYMVFMDSSLEAMATTYPISLDEMLTVPGVGAGKAAKFGLPMANLIKKYVEENDIIRPDDYRIRQVADKTSSKVSIIKSIDRKLDLNDLADGLGISYTELIGELEAIVEAGTKIDVSYFIDSLIDKDQQNEIISFFNSQEEDNLDTAFAQLSSDYEEDEIRLIRIQLLSELGN